MTRIAHAWTVPLSPFYASADLMGQLCRSRATGQLHLLCFSAGQRDFVDQTVESVHCENGMNCRSDAEAMEWRWHVIDYCGGVITAAACVYGVCVLAAENVTKSASVRSRLSETGISNVGCAAVMKAVVRLAAHRTTRCEFEYMNEHCGCKRQAYEVKLTCTTSSYRARSRYGDRR